MRRLHARGQPPLPRRVPTVNATSTHPCARRIDVTPHSSEGFIAVCSLDLGHEGQHEWSWLAQERRNGRHVEITLRWQDAQAKANGIQKARQAKAAAGGGE